MHHLWTHSEKAVLVYLKEKLNYISLNAREDIVHRFNVEHIVNENIKFYKSVI